MTQLSSPLVPGRYSSCQPSRCVTNNRLFEGGTVLQRLVASGNVARPHQEDRGAQGSANETS